jgi:hypothetical protein
LRGDFGDEEPLELLVAGVVACGLINEVTVGAELPA